MKLPDKTYTLEKTSVTDYQGAKEETYHYVSGSGHKIVFHAHPTQAFSWLFLEGGENMKAQDKLIKAFIIAMMSRKNVTVPASITCKALTIR